MHVDITNIAKAASAAMGALIAYLSPTFPFGLVCTLAVLVDCFSAWQLYRRVRRNKYGKSPSAIAYFTSKKMGNVFNSILKIYLIVVLAYLIDTQIFTFVDMYLANIIAGAFCFCQVWSILENESSENDAKWAKVLQKIMVDKASRHLDIDLSDLTESESNQEKTEEIKTETVINNGSK